MYLKRLSLLLLLWLPLAAQTNHITYYDASQYLILGTAEANNANPYYRLPDRLQQKVREPVWRLSQNSAGISIDFITNSPVIEVKWDLLYNFHMNHMAGTGIRGLDLYCLVDNTWQYVNTAIPQDSTNQYRLVENMTPETQHYRLYLPLYDGICNLSIGIDSTATIKSAKKPPAKPIVFYGTSITQGGCASRPGMAYSNIISRKLNRECINLGFSGNGRMETGIGEFIASIYAALIIIDCLPNMTADSVAVKTAELIKIIRKKQSTTPIVFIENLIYKSAYFDSIQMDLINNKNRVLRNEITKMKSMGFENIFLIESDELLGNDHEGTVDGVHLTDLGFMRFADHLIVELKGLNLIK